MYGTRDEDKKPTPAPAQSSFMQVVPLDYTSPDVIDRRDGQQQTIPDKLRDATIQVRDRVNSMHDEYQRQKGQANVRN